MTANIYTQTQYIQYLTSFWLIEQCYHLDIVKIKPKKVETEKKILFKNSIENFLRSEKKNQQEKK